MRSSFQTIILIIFSFAFVVAVAVFSGLFSIGSKKVSSEPQGTVVVWGILPNEQMQQYVAGFNAQGLKYSLVYTEHAPETFNQDLIVALANDTPPDVVIVSSELFSQFKDKLYPIPYSVFNERTFRDLNVDGAQVFLGKEGVMSVPLLVDPLVVYYNKDMLAKALYAVPPRSWTDLAGSVSRLTKRNNQQVITQSAIALGEPQNIDHVRDILSALFLQVGNPIVSYDRITGLSRAMLNQGTPNSDGNVPVVEAINFFTSFSDPTSTAYSWNKALLPSRDAFVSGKLAFYIGRASELFTIQAQNPNLSFDVIELFQAEDAPRPITFGSFIGASILNNAKNMPAAYAFVALLSADSAPIDQLSKLYALPPTRRELLLVPQEDPYVGVFFKSALSSFTWPDPNNTQTESIFRAMIQTITSGRAESDTAINEANASIQSNIR